MTPFSQELAWWITAFDLPALAGLFWMIWRTRQEHSRDITHIQSIVNRRNDQFREALNAFKLEVAKSYASQADMRDLERRIVNHLLRIEAKLDATALKAEALSASTKS